MRQKYKYFYEISVGILFLIASIYYLFFLNYSFHYWTDTAYYLTLAQNLANDTGYYMFNVGYNGEMPILKKAVTYYDPAYPWLISRLIILFNVSAEVGAEIINTIFWFVFNAGMIYFFYLLFRKQKHFFLLASFFLFFSSGLWSYPLNALSEMIFLGFFSWFCVFFYKMISRKKTNGKLLNFMINNKRISIDPNAILAALFFSAALFSRKATLGLLFGLGIFFIFIFIFIFIQKNKIKQFMPILLFSFLVALFYAFWLNRTYQISGNLIDKPIHNNPVNLWGIERTNQMITYYFNDALGIPERLNAFIPILLGVILIGILIVFFTKEHRASVYFCTPKRVWIFFMLTGYLLLIFYTGYKNPVNRTIGFSRFFYLTQPFLILLLIFLIQSFLQFKTKLANIFVLILGLIIGLSAVSSINRTRIYLTNIENKKNIEHFFGKIKQIPTPKDIVFSNHWQTYLVKAGKPCREIADDVEIKQCLDNWQTDYQNIYLFLDKGVGITYRKNAQSWKELLSRFKTENIIENENYIFAKINN